MAEEENILNEEHDPWLANIEAKRLADRAEAKAKLDAMDREELSEAYLAMREARCSALVENNSSKFYCAVCNGCGISGCCPVTQCASYGHDYRDSEGRARLFQAATEEAIAKGVDVSSGVLHDAVKVMSWGHEEDDDATTWESSGCKAIMDQYEPKE